MTTARHAASAGFPPIARADARLLVLGSLPSQASLEAGQYYAHPQNAFWRIMAVLAGAIGEYESRCRALEDAGIAVWDVLASSVRPGSMDADIQLSSAVPNNFKSFLYGHGDLRLICFNGRKAEQLFRRFVLPSLSLQDPKLATLPSTSPAYASMSLEEKTAAWSGIIGPLIRRREGT